MAILGPHEPSTRASDRSDNHPALNVVQVMLSAPDQQVLVTPELGWDLECDSKQCIVSAGGNEDGQRRQSLSCAKEGKVASPCVHEQCHSLIELWHRVWQSA